MYTLTLALALALGAPGQGAPQPSPPARIASAPAATLSFDELFEPGRTDLRPSAKLRSLDGARVRMTGFMADMEEPSTGGFYLVSKPMFAGEGGAGTGDLPPGAVLVVVRGAAGVPVAVVSRAVEVSGVLHVGPQTEPDGRVSFIRLVLDRAEDLPGVAAPRP